jgi:hypothetical protein
MLDIDQRGDASAAVGEAIEILAPLADHDPERHAKILDRALDLRDELRS